ncbi:MAG TPA: flavodoxin domain-containing protein [Glaciihabitans sp.]|nr:flavodoxin domain-containing protein [Glaciihabitans sp.]
MKAFVVYESMFGNTRRIAEAIASGLEIVGNVTVQCVTDTPAEVLFDTDLLVVGGPTHAHSWSSPTTRAEAAKLAADPNRALSAEPNSTGQGLREWVPALPFSRRLCAAFDTRADALRLLTGAAGVRIDKELHKRGMRTVSPPASFLVDSANSLLPGEEDRARAWGLHVAVAADGDTYGKSVFSSV